MVEPKQNLQEYKKKEEEEDKRLERKENSCSMGRGGNSVGKVTAV